MPDLTGYQAAKPSFIGAVPAAMGTHFRVWAPVARKVEVLFEGDGSRSPLEAEKNSYFAGLVSSARAGARYRFSLDGGEPFPDPASRYQPEGPHGPSEIIDPCAYVWSDGESSWSGAAIEGQVLYELHIGTFTPQGTYLSAISEFSRLRDLGITVLECMPLAEFAGNVGWGYDGVDLFAPFHGYGSPDDLRRMIDGAHQHGLGIILDVVYNHLGPDGNYLDKYSTITFPRQALSGEKPSISMEKTARPCGIFFWPTRLTGSQTIILTDCGLTPRNRFVTQVRMVPISSRRSSNVFETRPTGVAQ